LKIPIIKYKGYIPNINIGVIDTKTYLSTKDDTYKIYALRFKTNLVDNPVI
jgi:hypothetical protein